MTQQLLDDLVSVHTRYLLHIFKRIYSVAVIVRAYLRISFLFSACFHIFYRVFQDLQSGTSNTTLQNQRVCGTSELNALSNNSITGREGNEPDSNNQNITDQPDTSSIVAEKGTSSDVAQLVSSSNVDQSCMDVVQLGTSLNMAHPGSTATVHNSITNLYIDKPGSSLNVGEPGSSSSSLDNLLHQADKSINTSIKLLETNDTLLHNVNGHDSKDGITTVSNNSTGNTSHVNGENETRSTNDNTINMKGDANNVKGDTNNVKDTTDNLNNETNNANVDSDFVARTCEDKVCVLSDGAKDAAEQDIAAQSTVASASEYVMKTTEISDISMELDTEHDIGKDISEIGVGKDNSKDNEDVSHQQTTASVRNSEYISGNFGDFFF